MAMFPFQTSETKFIRISQAEGSFYESSKSPMDGYTKHVSKQGTVSYRRSYYKITGKLSSFKIRSQEWEDRKVTMFDVILFDREEGENGTRYFISFPLFTANNTLSPMARTFVRYYKNIRDFDQVAFAIYKDKKGYAQLAIRGFDRSKMQDIKTDWYYSFDHPEVPPMVTKTVMGKKVYDFTEQDNFFYEKLQEYMQDFAVKRENEEDPAPVDTAVAEAANTPAPEQTGMVFNTNDMPEDDLPF